MPTITLWKWVAKMPLDATVHCITVLTRNTEWVGDECPHVPKHCMVGASYTLVDQL